MGTVQRSRFLGTPRHQTFGQLLTLYLQSPEKNAIDGQPISAQDLARILDRSEPTISNWKNDVSVPRVGSAMIDRMIAYFGLDPHAGVQFHKAAVARHIHQNRTSKGREIASSPALDILLKWLEQTSEDAEPRTGSTAIRRPATYHGAQEVLVALVKRLSAIRGTNPSTIRMSFQSAAFNTFTGTPTELHELKRQFTELRHLGWDVRSVWQPDADPVSYLNFMNGVLGFETYGSGASAAHTRVLARDRYWHFGDDKAMTASPYDFLLLPGAAVLLLGGEQYSRADSAVVLENPRHVLLLENYFDKVYEVAEDLDHAVYFADDPVPWSDLSAVGRIAYHKDLRRVPPPQRGYRPGSRAARALGPVLSRWANAKDEVVLFYGALDRGIRFFDIIPQAVFPDLSNDRKQAGAEDSVASDVAAQAIENLIYLLERYPLVYNLALPMRVEEDRVPRSVNHFSVHGRHHIVLGLGPSPDSPQMSLIIQLPKDLLADSANYCEALYSHTTVANLRAIEWLETRLPKARRAKRRRASNLYELLEAQSDYGRVLEL